MVSINFRPIIIVGKMGSGKTSVVDVLTSIYSTSSLRYERIVTYTTRLRRTSENEESYHFVTNDKFEEMKADGKFAEWYETEKDGVLIQYGSAIEDYTGFQSNEQQACIKLLVLNPEGTKKAIKKLRPGNCTVVYLKAKDETLIKHCLERGTERKEQIIERLEREAKEFGNFEKIADLTINCDSIGIDVIANIIDRYVHYDLY